jgi:hypothetical protein
VFIGDSGCLGLAPRVAQQHRANAPHEACFIAERNGSGAIFMRF